MDARDRTEVCAEISIEDAAVLDGYCAATKQNRTTVLRQILREWSKSKLHEATLILRTAGRNPTPPGRSGDAPE